MKRQYREEPFEEFGTEQWSVIASGLPLGADAQRVRRLLEGRLREFSDGMSDRQLDTLLTPGFDPEAYAALIAAAKNFAAAFKWQLCEAAFDRQMLARRDRLLFELGEIVNWAETRRAHLADPRLRLGANPPGKPGPKADALWEWLIDQLSVIWCEAGGDVGGHGAGEGGPFIRFLRLAISPLLLKEPTASEARRWMRDAKRRWGGEIKTSGQ